MVFLVHPTVVSVLLFALVERCFVSRMWDFLFYAYIADQGKARDWSTKTVVSHKVSLFLSWILGATIPKQFKPGTALQTPS